MNNTLFDNQLQSLGEERNLADAQYIFDVFQAHIRYKNTMNATNEPYSLATVNVVDRNALQKMWEEARLPTFFVKHVIAIISRLISLGLNMREHFMQKAVI